MNADANANAAALMCSRSGCTKRWTCNFGQRLCSEHDAARFASPGAAAQKQIPETLRPAAAPWHDVEARDGEPLPF